MFNNKTQISWSIYCLCWFKYVSRLNIDKMMTKQVGLDTNSPRTSLRTSWERVYELLFLYILVQIMISNIIYISIQIVITAISFMPSVQALIG